MPWFRWWRRSARSCSTTMARSPLLRRRRFLLGRGRGVLAGPARRQARRDPAGASAAAHLVALPRGLNARAQQATIPPPFDLRRLLSAAHRIPAARRWLICTLYPARSLARRAFAPGVAGNTAPGLRLDVGERPVDGG